MSDDGAVSARVIALLVAVLAAHALLAWHVRSRGIFTFGDDSAYILLGRALRSFSYREVQFIGEPVAARFPPGYPAILALVGMAGERLWLISAAGIAITVSGMVALFDVVRRRWSTELGLLVTASVAVTPPVVANSGAIASEGAFMAVTLWSLWAADRCERGERRGVLAAGAAIVAALVRSAGVTLPLALGVHWLYRRRYRWVVRLGLASALTVGSWLAWTAIAPRQEVRRSYIGDAMARRPDESLAASLARRVASNTRIYVSQIALTEQGLPVTPRTTLDNVGWVVVLGGLGFIGILAAWRRWNAAFWFFSAYSALLAAWAFPIERFFQPILPLVITFVLAGAWTAAARVRRNQRAIAYPAALVTAVLAFFALRADFKLAEHAAACDRAWVDCAAPASLDYVEAARYVAAHTPAGARLVVPKNATLYYYAPRQSVFWDETTSQDSASFMSFLTRKGVTHVMTSPVYEGHRKLTQLLLAHCDRFELMRALSPDTMILALRAPDAGDAPPRTRDTPACAAIARAEKRAVDADVAARA